MMRERRERVIPLPREVTGGARDTFSNLFNLGTQRVSESYLREYEIKQSDKCLFCRRHLERSRSWPGWNKIAFPSPHLLALWCVRLAPNACHTRSVYEANLLPFSLKFSTRLVLSSIYSPLYVCADTSLRSCAFSLILYFIPLFFNRCEYALSSLFFSSFS